MANFSTEVLEQDLMDQVFAAPCNYLPQFELQNFDVTFT